MCVRNLLPLARPLVLAEIVQVHLEPLMCYLHAALGTIAISL